ncbi:MAG: 4'-phosphopantetheinyl transferase superfamily protein [Archangium sp.]|nr:4'-phosphopantetheinyl transferase superfamily protein [Archangium sp.]
MGTDTERSSRAPRLLALAPNVFAPAELSDLAALPTGQRAHRALTLWTLKESYIKARGMGLALALDGFAFRFDAHGGIRLEVEPRLDDDGARWQFETRTHGEHQLSTAIRADARVEPTVHEALLD